MRIFCRMVFYVLIFYLYNGTHMRSINIYVESPKKFTSLLVCVHVCICVLNRIFFLLMNLYFVKNIYKVIEINKMSSYKMYIFLTNKMKNSDIYTDWNYFSKLKASLQKTNKCFYSFCNGADEIFLYLYFFPWIFVSNNNLIYWTSELK